MAYRVPNPLPLASRLRAIAREEGTRAAFGRVATYSRLQLAQSTVGRAVGFGNAGRSAFAMGPVWADLAQKGVFFTPGAEPGARHVAIIAESSLPQCTKYRVRQMECLCRGLGLDVTIADQRDEADALTAMQMASHVIFYRLEPSPRTWMYMYEARRLGVPVVYDLDDPLFSVPAITGSASHLAPALTRHFADAAPGFLAMMSACDAITVSTPAMVDEVRAFLNRPVFLRRNFADDETLAPARQLGAVVKRGTGLTLACASGSEGRHGDIAPILPVLEQFLGADASRRLILIGRGLEGHAGLSPHLADQVFSAPFQDYDLYLAQLGEADAVLVPLAADPFNACKSAVRAMDAAAAGRPVIASPLGDLPLAVEQGVTGWLADAPTDWLAALNTLADLPDRGRALGAAARRKLESEMCDPLAPTVTDPDFVDWLTQ